MKYIGFPEIGQFRQAIRAVQHRSHFVGLDPQGEPIYDGLRPCPTIKYKGTVKLHGTNAAICKDINTNEIWFQSRERIIAVGDDNKGFAQFASNIDLDKLFSLIVVPQIDINPENADDETSVISIYGEWCGGGIQKKVAISDLDKMFVIFAIKYRGLWLSEKYRNLVKIPDQKVFNSLDYPSFEMDINFQIPEITQNKLVDITMGVEKECPVGKSFGVSGVGEGVVWTPIEEGWNSSKYWFKVKGKKHSVSHTKTLATIDIEKVNSMQEFLDNVVTENRLNQGVDILKSQKKVDVLIKADIGDFIRWIYNDVLKEEKDTLLESGLEEKELGGPLAKRVKEWLFKQSFFKQ